MEGGDSALNPRQFGKVTDLAAFRRAHAPERKHPLRMSTEEMVGHVLHDHGVEPEEFAGKAMLEYLHADLHRTGPDHVPNVEHTHSTDYR